MDHYHPRPVQGQQKERQQDPPSSTGNTTAQWERARTRERSGAENNTQTPRSQAWRGANDYREWTPAESSGHNAPFPHGQRAGQVDDGGSARHSGRVPDDACPHSHRKGSVTGPHSTPATQHSAIKGRHEAGRGLKNAFVPSHGVPPAPVPAPAGPAATERGERRESRASYNNHISDSDPAHTARWCPSANADAQHTRHAILLGSPEAQKGTMAVRCPAHLQLQGEADTQIRTGPPDGYRVRHMATRGHGVPYTR